LVRRSILQPDAKGQTVAATGERLHLAKAQLLPHTLRPLVELGNCHPPHRLREGAPRELQHCPRELSTAPLTI
jgi:hypothetical protein